MLYLYTLYAIYNLYTVQYAIMKAAVINKYNHIEWESVPTPQITENEVLVKVNYASICGSDQHILSGDFHPRTQLPLIPGHEFAGEVVETGSKVSNARKGDRVTVDPIIWCGQCAACKVGHYPACSSLKLIGVDMDGGFGEYVAVREDRLFHLDDNIDDRTAALVEVLSIGFHAASRGDVGQGERIVIWGAGKVGQCILQAVKTKTEQPMIMVDPVENRLNMALKAFSDTQVINPEKEDPVARIMEFTGNRGVDIAFEAVGHAKPVDGVPHPVRGCVQSIRGAGRVVVLGLSDEPATLNMKEFIWKEAKIIASRVSHGEFSETISHLSAHQLRADNLITARMPASKAQEAFNLLEEHPEDHLKILLAF